MLKRTVSIFICIFLLFGMALNASAKAYVLINDYRLSKNDSGNLELGGYEGTASELTVPSSFGGNTVTTIESRAFADNTSLTSVTLPDTMVSIGSGAFSDSALVNMSIGKNTKTIGSNAFYNCNKLKNVDLGTKLTAISGYAFNRCSSLTFVELPNTVKSIGDYAFFKCISLEYIVIPPSVTEIAVNAFDECNRMTIRGEVNSYAYQYAKEFQIPFETLSGDEVPTEPVEKSSIGDADGNGIIDVNDVRILQMFCANIVDRSYIVPDQSDVNGDGKLSIKDCTSIQRYIAYGHY